MTYDPKPKEVETIALGLPASLRDSEVAGARFVEYETDENFEGGLWLELAFVDMDTGEPNWSDPCFVEPVESYADARAALADLELDDVL